MSGERVLPKMVDWQLCQAAQRGAPGCIGGQLGPGLPCFAHTDRDDREAGLKALREGGSLDFVHGVEFTEELLAEVLEAAPREDDQSILRDADLRGATFQGDAWFGEVSFQGDARFGGVSFQGDAWFNLADFKGKAWFDSVSFQGNAEFNSVSFRGDAWFRGASFRGGARFNEVSFKSYAEFSAASFRGLVMFEGTRFHSDAAFDEAMFEEPLNLGRFQVGGWLRLDRITFTEPVQVEATATGLSCRRHPLPGWRPHSHRRRRDHPRGRRGARSRYRGWAARATHPGATPTADRVSLNPPIADW
jgi:pentapeptide repeat protein